MNTNTSSPQQTASGSKTSAVSNQTFIEPEMVVIPPGRFEMGSDSFANGKPIHTVTIAKPFSIAKYCVTFDEYDLFVKARKRELPGDKSWGRGKRPVINVSWADATAYAKWLSDLTGNPYRLPSEAEWEYAARAGATSIYYWGGSANDADKFAWFAENSEGKTHAVGQKKPNNIGLCDMAGNVYEWVEDCWHDNYKNAPADGSAWVEQNDGDCTRRVLRGGSWHDMRGLLRLAYRYRFYPVYRDDFLGFRLAQD